MVAQREIPIPQAMQRHTGCAWVHPVRAVEKSEKPKGEDKGEAAAERRDVGPGEQPTQRSGQQAH